MKVLAKHKLTKLYGVLNNTVNRTTENVVVILSQDQPFRSAIAFRKLYLCHHHPLDAFNVECLESIVVLKCIISIIYTIYIYSSTEFYFIFLFQHNIFSIILFTILKKKCLMTYFITYDKIINCTIYILKPINRRDACILRISTRS